MIRNWLTRTTAFAALGLMAAAPALAEYNPSVGGAAGDGATIKGVVKFDGRQAPRKPIRMTADKFCDQAHKEPVRSERYVFGENNTLQNVFVYVSKGAPEGAEPAQQTVLDQVGCQYVPHVVGVVAGEPLKILNSDSTLHNVKCSADKNSTFNEGMPVKGMTLEKTFSKPEMAVEFKCDVHPWMNAYAHVVEHPFFAVTQDQGTFEIAGLPDGTYEVSVWHEFPMFKPAEETQTVVITDGEPDKELVFTYAPPK